MGGSAHLPLQNTICHTRLGVFPGILCSNALTPKKKTLADSSGLHGHPHRGTQFNIHIDLKSKSKSEKKGQSWQDGSVDKGTFPKPGDLTF